MSNQSDLPRRWLIGSGVVASFLIPSRLQRALAETGVHAHRHGKPLPPLPARRLVMLDPGHGGKDPGAIGISGTFEKNVSLAAAFQLKRQLGATGRYHVEMTRQRDVFIPLESRVAHAQGRAAVLFVSMHADALTDHSVRGASVYTLAANASDAQTAQLARRENSADRFAGAAFRGTSPEVAHILASLVQRETRVGSARMARDMVGQLDQSVPMLPNPARHAGFVVLKAADIPSVLVEMGFMSNRQDEAALRRTDHRARVTLAMQRAIDAYFLATDHAMMMAR